ncbi:MAG: 16S rRNA processing protein RimM [Desulfomonile tiedjei]|nr:16S rRNA processing protein RimM [Desulfomonile tiedjei]
MAGPADVTGIALRARSMGTSRKKLVVIGKAVKPFGVKGELKIHAYTESLDVFGRSAVLFFDNAPFEVVKTRVHGGAILASLEGVDNPESARELVGKLVQTEEDNLPPKEEDEYYWIELIGMKVSTTDGRDLGEITRITPTGAHDVLHVEGSFGEVLLPYIDEVVMSVDTEKNEMLVDPLEGLVPDA